MQDTLIIQAKITRALYHHSQVVLNINNTFNMRRLRQIVEECQKLLPADRPAQEPLMRVMVLWDEVKTLGRSSLKTHMTQIHDLLVKAEMLASEPSGDDGLMPFDATKFTG